MPRKENELGRNTPSTISQDIVIPALELMCSSNALQDILPRLQTQMIRVIQTQPASRRLQLLWSQAFERRLRRNGHEERQLDWSMRKREVGSTSLGSLADAVRRSAEGTSRTIEAYGTTSNEFECQCRRHWRV
jgi:hypothetical protein